MQNLSGISKAVANSLKVFSQSVNLSSKRKKFTPSKNVIKINSDDYEIKTIWIEVGQEVEVAIEEYDRERSRDARKSTKQRCIDAERVPSERRGILGGAISRTR